MSYVGVSLYYGGCGIQAYTQVPFGARIPRRDIGDHNNCWRGEVCPGGVTGTSYETFVATDRSDMRPSRELLVEAEIEASKPRVWNGTKRHGWNVLLRAFRVPQGPPGSTSDGKFTRGNQSSCGKFVREPVC